MVATPRGTLPRFFDPLLRRYCHSLSFVIFKKNSLNLTAFSIKITEEHKIHLIQAPILYFLGLGSFEQGSIKEHIIDELVE